MKRSTIRHIDPAAAQWGLRDRYIMTLVDIAIAGIVECLAVLFLLIVDQPAQVGIFIGILCFAMVVGIVKCRKAWRLWVEIQELEELVP